MAFIVTVNPNGTTNSTDFPPNGVSAHAVLSDGSDGSYISRQGYAGESHAAYGDAVTQLPGGIGRILSVTPKARCQGVSDFSINGGATLQGGVRIASTLYTSLSQLARQQDGILNATGTAYVTNPATGQPWSIADVNAMGWWVGAQSYAFDGDNFFIYELSFDVSYDTPPGGFAFGMS